MFPCISWERSPLPRPRSREKTPHFREKNTTFPESTRKIISQRDAFWNDNLFRLFEENIIFPCIFFRKIIFHFPSGCKIILSGKRIVTFPDNTTKRIFQGDFFGKNIFSGRLEKKYGFPCSGVWGKGKVFLMINMSISFYWDQIND